MTFGKPLKLHTPVVMGSGGDIHEHVKVDIEDPKLCPRYTARMVRNVKIAPSPKWLRQRLRANGVRPINNIVDITNYVMLEYGQPMHAFDYRYVGSGKIIVRRSEPGEALTTLDGNVRTLTPGMLVIADETKPSVLPASWAARTARSWTTRSTSSSNPRTSTAPPSARRPLPLACARSLRQV